MCGGITKWQITLAEKPVEALGVARGIHGKSHLGDTEGRYPTVQGFDEWIGILDPQTEPSRRIASRLAATRVPVHPL